MISREVGFDKTSVVSNRGPGCGKAEQTQGHSAQRNPPNVQRAKQNTTDFKGPNSIPRKGGGEKNNKNNNICTDKSPLTGTRTQRAGGQKQHHTPLGRFTRDMFCLQYQNHKPTNPTQQPAPTTPTTPPQTTQPSHPPQTTTPPPTPNHPPNLPNLLPTKQPRNQPPSATQPAALDSQPALGSGLHAALHRRLGGQSRERTQHAALASLGGPLQGSGLMGGGRVWGVGVWWVNLVFLVARFGIFLGLAGVFKLRM